MTTKALGRYFKGFKASESQKNAITEIRNYLTENGFLVSRQSAQGLGTRKFVTNRSEHFYLATQLKTGKTIVFDVAVNTIRDRVKEKLKVFGANKKVIFFINTESDKREVESKFITLPSHTGEEHEIEVINIPVKTSQDLVQEAIERKKAMDDRKISSIALLKNDLEREVFDKVFTHLETVVENTGQVGKLNWVYAKMKEDNPLLEQYVSPAIFYAICKEVHAMWCEAVYK